MSNAGAQRRFTGFTREGLDLLCHLEANNNQRWFTAHRRPLHKLVVQPALDLVVELQPLLHEQISPALRAEPRVGGSIQRLKHDVRSSPEEPYRTYVELWFWEGQGYSHQHPGFFVRVAPDRLVVGVGAKLFPPSLLLRYRELVDDAAVGRKLASILSRFASAGYQVTGPCLRRTPRPYSDSHERAALLRHLGLIVKRTERLPAMMPESVLGPSLPQLVVHGFAWLRDVYRWLRLCEYAERW